MPYKMQRLSPGEENVVYRYLRLKSLAVPVPASVHLFKFKQTLA